MSEKNDSIQSLLSDLPNYSEKDFTDYVPYERAARVCKTRKELEECLDKIYEAAKKIGVDENYAMLFDHICLEDFLIDIGEMQPPFEPPEEVLEIARLEKELEAAKINQQIIIIETPLPTEQPSNINQFPSSYNGDEEEYFVHNFVLGGRRINLFFGDFIVNEETGSISVWSDIAQSEMEICSHFVAPSAYVKTHNDGEKVNLIYFRDNEWHELKNLKKSTLYESGNVAKYLVDHGIDANQNAGHSLSDYFRSMEQFNRNSLIPVKHTITSLGWNNKFSAFIPYGEQFEFGAGNSNKRLFAGVCTKHGSIEKWIETMKMFRDEEHTIARIVLAASFASVLIRPLKGMRFAINLVGKSGLGKSVALRLAAGVWGDPDTVIASFGSTVYGALLRSNFLSDLPLILDESETKKHKTDFDEFIYTMCGDYDRVKANGDEEMPTSKNCIFVSGEHPLMNDKSNLGARNRVLDLFCDSFIFFDEDRMKQYMELQDDNFGFAGQYFVSRLLSNSTLEYADEIYMKHQKSFSLDRQSRIPAVILTADELIDEWLFHDGVRLTAEHLMPYLRGEKLRKEQIDYTTVHATVEDWIIEQIRKNGKAETEYGKVKARWKDRPAAYVFRKGVLERIVSETGGDFFSYLEWAKQNNKLAAESGRYDSLQSFSNEEKKRTRYYTIYLPSSLQ